MEGKKLKSIYIDELFEKSVTFAKELFFTGKIFIYPTDTIYGLGGNPFNREAVRRINDIKGRDKSKQFIWLVSDLDVIMNYAEINYESHLQFLKSIYPASVSVILNLNKKTIDSVSYNSAAFRIPDQNFCTMLLSGINLPLISTSVNKSGQNALNDYNAIEKEFSEDVDALFYTKSKIKPIASTIIDLTAEKPKLIREGTIKFVDLLEKFN